MVCFGLSFYVKSDGKRRRSLAEKKRKSPRPIGGAIESVIGSLGLGKSYNGWLVVTRWPEIVGEQIAKRAKATRFDDGVLFVVVEDAAWRQNLSMQTDDIMAAIRKYPFGKVVRQIRLIGTERGHT